jgi:hypothetical protein
MQHELERFGTTPSQLIVVIRVVCPTPPVAQAKTRGIAIVF